MSALAVVAIVFVFALFVFALTPMVYETTPLIIEAWRQMFADIEYWWQERKHREDK